MTDIEAGRSTAAPLANAGYHPEPATDSGVRPAAAPDRTLHMIGNSHIDPVWLWPWQEGYQEARATFWSAIQRMEEYPDFVFTCDQMVLLSWVEEADPELFARIREREAEGRWVNVGGWWVEPDCNLPMGEGFVRQGLLGQRYLLSRFGRAATVGMNADPFGHNAMLPQILRGQGIDTYTFLRPSRYESDLEDSLFWWEAPDGSRVLAYRIPFEYGSPPGSIEGQTERSLAALDDADRDFMVFYGVGNHGGGPTKANIDSIHRFDRMGTFGRMRMSSPRDYFDSVLAKPREELDALPVRRDDLQHHAAGCYSAHSGIKAWQRRAQYALLSAERWAAVVAATSGVRYPRADLERAWKQVAFNQFHDVLPGSAIETAYDDARDQLGEAVSIAKRVIVLAHNTIARQIDIPFEERTQPIVVFNPHSWPVSVDVPMQYGAQKGELHVVDGEGREVVHQATQSLATTDDVTRGAVVFRADVPALGYRLYRLRPGRGRAQRWSEGEPSGLRIDEGVLENDLVRIVVDPETGWLSSYLDKSTGLDLVAGTDGRMHTQICEDPTDTWGHRVVSYAWPGASMRLRRIVVRERGPLCGRVRIEREWGSSTLVEELVLDHDSRVLRVEVTLDWHEQAHLMKLRFPTRLEGPRAEYEVPFGHISRPVDGAEEPAQSWVDISGTLDGRPAGLTLITTDKHAYDVSPGDEPSIGITAVRSPVYAWHDPRALDGDGVYSYQDQGRQRFSYELVPHDGDWRSTDPVRRAAVLGSPVRAMQESFHPGALPERGSFAHDGQSGVLVTALKGTEDDGDDVVVRAVEWRGVHAQARIRLPFVDRVIDAEFEPSRIRTWRVPRDPAEPVVEVDLVERPLAVVADAPADDERAGATAVTGSDAGAGNAEAIGVDVPEGTAEPAAEPGDLGRLDAGELDAGTSDLD